MKKLCSLILLLILIIVFPPPIFAEESAAEDPAEIAADEIGIDVSQIQGDLPDSAYDMLDDNGITPTSTDSMTQLNPLDIFGYIWETLTSKITYPLRVFASILAVILLSALVEGLQDTISDPKLTRIYGIICVMVAVSIISAPLSETIQSAAASLSEGGLFMASYIPVFAGITASSGHITSAASYSLVVVFASDAAVIIASNYMVPILSICMALGIIEAINPNFSLSGITSAIQKITQIVIAFTMVIFLGLLSTQSIIGASADTLGVKAAKFAASNFIPVVGSAVADAYTTVKASLGLLRGGVGFFGIAAIFAMVVPPLLEVGMMRLAFSAAELVSDMFGADAIKVLLKNCVKILSLIFSLLVCFSIMLTISTAIVMLVGLSGG
ncbi:MAG: stage III sporulation protein AE [Ruminococcus sp.]|jgi:stage III sporulation protein AE|nr:stage III sporulation protein AE [Ruminococcus sp.]